MQCWAIRSNLETEWIVNKKSVDRSRVVTVQFDGRGIRYKGLSYGFKRGIATFSTYECNRFNKCSASINLINSAQSGQVLAILVNQTHTGHKIVSIPFNFSKIASHYLARSSRLQFRNRTRNCTWRISWCLQVVTIQRLWFKDNFCWRNRSRWFERWSMFFLILSTNKSLILEWRNQWCCRFVK